MDQNIYDNPEFFDGYQRLRESPSAANSLVEKPALFSLCPDFTGKTVLDLGCGCDAGFLIEKVLEPMPDEMVMARYPAYKSYWHKPDFLLVRTRKLPLDKT